MNMTSKTKMKKISKFKIGSKFNIRPKRNMFPRNEDDTKMGDYYQMKTIPKMRTTADKKKLSRVDEWLDQLKIQPTQSHLILGLD